MPIRTVSLIFLLLFISISLFHCKKDTKPYFNKTHGFSIDVPKKWEVKDTKIPYENILLILKNNNAKENTKPNILVTYEQIKGKSLEVFTKSLIKRLKTSKEITDIAKDIKTLKTKKIEIRNKKAMQFSYTFTGPIHKDKLIAIASIVIYNKRGFVITGVTPIKIKSSFIKIYKKVVNSFRAR